MAKDIFIPATPEEIAERRWKLIFEALTRIEKQLKRIEERLATIEK